MLIAQEIKLLTAAINLKGKLFTMKEFFSQPFQTKTQKKAKIDT